MGVTIKQIAQIVGVSRGTVDRVIHGRSGVSQEIKGKIEQVMGELNYSPNAVAKALKTVQTPMTFGVIVPGNNKFYDDIRIGIDEAAQTYAPYGVSIIKLEEEDLTEQRQLIQLKNLEKLNVNGIIMVAVDAPAVRKCVNSIAEHIPIITYNSDLTDTKRLCFIGQDHIAAGRVSGDLMGMILRRNGKIAILAGSRNMLAHMQRADGFRAALRARGVTGVLPEIYATQESDDKAYEIVTRLIATYDDLVAICVTGGGKVGAGNALSDSGKADNIKLACYDTLPETVQHIKTGVVDYTIAQDPFIQGYMPVKIMYEYLTYGILPKWERILTRIDIRVKDNIENKGYEVFTGKYSNKI